MHPKLLRRLCEKKNRLLANALKYDSLHSMHVFDCMDQQT